jgi:hypothetical protein
MPRLLEARSAQRRAQLPSQQSHRDKPRAPWLSLLTTAQLAIGLTGYVAVLGYVVYTGILRESTSLLPLNVAPITYIALGMNFIFAFLFVAIPYTLAAIVAFYIVVLAIKAIRDKQFKPIKSLMVTVQALWEIVTSEKSVLILMIIFLYWSAGSPGSVYKQLPLAQPTAPNQRGILLVFKESIDTTLWSLSIDPQNNRRTQRLNLIAELEDGLLVRDTNTGVVVEVKNDAISGLIDNSSLSPTVTPTLIPPTPMAGP